MVELVPARRPAVDPVTRFVRSLDGEYYLLREVADHLGIKINSMRTLARKYPKEMGPSLAVMFGELKIFLYTPEDVDRVVAYRERRRAALPQLDDLAGGPGRPVMWTNEENRRRHQMHSQLYYWRRRAEALSSIGQLDRAAVAARRARQLAAALEAERQRRLAQVSDGRSLAA